MKAAMLLAAAAGASGQVVPMQQAINTMQRAIPGGMQQAIDTIFKEYLTPEQQAHACPFARIAEKCEEFNTTMTLTRTCHQACEHGDFECHLKCPKARPTSVGELLQLGQAMLCHKSCGADRLCHRTQCSCPFDRKRAACAKLAEVHECHQRGGNHMTCKLDEDAKELLLSEPWSLVKDVVNHVVDFVLPPPLEYQATEEEVHGCHARCGWDRACHKACPTGQWGILKEQCGMLGAAKACHQSCKLQDFKCPFEKMACHMKCPMSMPSSVEELKVVAEHMAYHADCGRSEVCHKSAPKPQLWAEKKEMCAAYDRVAACHKGCHEGEGHGHECHMRCPHLDLHSIQKLPPSPAGSLAKEVASSLLI